MHTAHDVTSTLCRFPDVSGALEGRVASLRCTHPLRVSFQYNYRRADSIALVSICGRLMRSTFQYISKFIPTVSPGDLHTLSPAMTRAYGGAAGNARQPFCGGGGAAGYAWQPFR